MNTHEETLKQQIRTLLQKHISGWTEEDVSDFSESVSELNSLGWSLTYPGEAQVEFRRINVADRSEAVRLGYVPE